MFGDEDEMQRRPQEGEGGGGCGRGTTDETDGTLDEYVVAGGSGKSGERSVGNSVDPLFLPEPMDL